MKKIVALLLTVLLLMSSVTAFAASPRVLSQPQDQTVDEGGSCTFSVKGKNYKGITWRFRDPMSGEEVLASDAMDVFSGLEIKGKNSQQLRLNNIPAQLDGWQVYCTFNKGSSKTNTQLAWLFVNPRGGESAAKGHTEELLNASAAMEELNTDDNELGYMRTRTQDGEVVVTAVGATMREIVKGKLTGPDTDELRFEDGEANFTITADFKPDYWVINGVRYDFNKTVKKIKVTELHESVTFEAVAAGAAPQTLSSAAAIQNARTGETCEITCKSANMCHLTASDKGAGGWFKQFDFTEDYQNRATGFAERGGQVTFRTKAADVEDKKVAYWYFNDAKFDFDSTVTSFIVRTLDRSMFYQPIYEKVTVFYTVTTSYCSISSHSGGQVTGGGGKYRVEKGTKITVRSKWGETSFWTINGHNGYRDLASVSCTVNSNMSFVASPYMEVN